MPLADKKAFVGKMAQHPMHVAAGSREWFATSADKILFHSIMTSARLRIPETLAITQVRRHLPDVPTIADADGLARIPARPVALSTVRQTGRRRVQPLRRQRRQLRRQRRRGDSARRRSACGRRSGCLARGQRRYPDPATAEPSRGAGRTLRTEALVGAPPHLRDDDGR